MMFMMLGIYLFLKGMDSGKKSAKIALCCCSGAAFAAAGWIRITAAFFLIGIMAYLICCKSRKNHVTAAVSSIAAFAVVFSLLTSVGNSLIPDSYDSENRKIPTVHWIMMGLNPETNGYYNADDVRYTESFSTYDEKTSGDISLLKERLNAHTPVSLTKLCLKKMQIMWSNGQHNIKNQASQASDYGALYQYTVGAKNDFFVYFNQISWSALLILSLLSVIFALGRKYHGIDAALQIGLFGFFIFYLVWETNRRYSLFCIPVLIALASGTIPSMYELVQKSIVRASNPRKTVFVRSYAALGVVFLVGMAAAFGVKWNHYTNENIRFNKTAFLQRAAENKFELNSGDVYEESFPVKQGFNRVSLMFSGDKDKAVGEYEISGRTDNDKIIFQRSCQAADLLKNKEYSFDTESFVPDGREYITVKVECISSGDEAVSLRGEKYYPCNDTKFYENGKLQPNASMMLNVTERVEGRYMPPAMYLTAAAVYLMIWIMAFGVPVIVLHKKAKK